MSSSDPVEIVTENIATAAVVWTAEKISKVVEQFKNRDVAFIGNKEDIQLVVKQRQSAEWKNYSKWIKNPSLRIPIQIGISLRQFNSDSSKLQDLRNKVSKKYGSQGLHVAEFVQNRILGKYIESLLANAQSDEEIGTILEDFLNNIDRYCVFIKNEDKPERKSEEFKTRIYSLIPKVFVMYSRGEAIKVGDQIQELLIPQLSDYALEEYFFPEEKQKIIFFNRKINV